MRGPGCEVEQCPVPIALKEGIEPLRESPRGLRILVGAGEHPGPRDDFAAGVPFALGGRRTGTAGVRAQERPVFRLTGNRTPPLEVGGNTPDSDSVIGIASVALRGPGVSLADVYRLA